MLFLAILLLLAAVGLLVAAIYTGQTVLAWGSVGLSALVVLALLGLLRRARRRRREAAEADPDAALDDEHDVSQDDKGGRDDDLASDDLASDDAVPDGTAPDGATQDEAALDEADPDDAEQASPQPHAPSSTTPAEPADEHSVGAAEASGGSDVQAADTKSDTGSDDADPDDIEPDEEDTDAADLLVVWELPDEVLVVDEHPRYHLARCSWPDAAATERLPVQEARELGFTPCAQCRPDAALARKRRTALAKQDPAKQDPKEQDPAEQDTAGTGTGRESGQEADRGAGSGGQDSDSSAVLG